MLNTNGKTEFSNALELRKMLFKKKDLKIKTDGSKDETYQIDKEKGTVNFGDGVTGERPSSGSLDKRIKKAKWIKKE